MTEPTANSSVPIVDAVAQMQLEFHDGDVALIIKEDDMGYVYLEPYLYGRSLTPNGMVLNHTQRTAFGRFLLRRTEEDAS